MISLLIVAIVGGVVAVVMASSSSPTTPSPANALVLPPPKTFPEVSDLAPEAELIDKRFASLSYGVHTFLWWNAMYRMFDLENVRQLNFAYVKESFTWDNIQPIEGAWKWHLADEVVDEVEYRQRRLVARLDSAPDWAIRSVDNAETPPFDVEAFAVFCGEVASRYKGRIEGYQIWNEPNLTREWAESVPNPKAYVKLMAPCAEAIRTADPDAIIISAGISPTGTRDHSAMPDEEYLWRMYEAGASPHFDVLGLHAPGYGLPPEYSVEEAAQANRHRWGRFRHVEDMRAIMVANGDAHKQIALTEMGWTTDNREDSIYSWFGVSQEKQAEYLVDAYAYAAEHWRPWVGLMVTIYISKDVWTPDDEQWWWAIDEATTPPAWKNTRPAFEALANMEKISDNPDFAEPARDPNERYELEPLPPRN